MGNYIYTNIVNNSKANHKRKILNKTFTYGFMKILVTGHRGFIGGHIYNYLKSNGYDVYGYDLGDQLNDIKYDYIIHMAARGLIRLSAKYPYEYYRADLTVNFADRIPAMRPIIAIVYPYADSTSNIPERLVDSNLLSSGTTGEIINQPKPIVNTKNQ